MARFSSSRESMYISLKYPHHIVKTGLLNGATRQWGSGSTWIRDCFMLILVGESNNYKETWNNPERCKNNSNKTENKDKETTKRHKTTTKRPETMRCKNNDRNTMADAQNDHKKTTTTKRSKTTTKRSQEDAKWPQKITNTRWLQRDENHRNKVENDQKWMQNNNKAT